MFNVEKKLDFLWGTHSLMYQYPIIRLDNLYINLLDLAKLSDPVSMVFLSISPSIPNI